MPYQPSSRTQPVPTSHEPPSLATTRLQEPAPEEEQEYGLEFPVVPQATESCQSSNSSQDSPLLDFSQIPGLTLNEEQGFSLELPFVQCKR
jgi:hypothetical protein